MTAVTRVVLTAQDVAARFGVARETVWHWKKNGKLEPDYLTEGGHARYYEDRIEKLLRGES